MQSRPFKALGGTDREGCRLRGGKDKASLVGVPMFFIQWRFNSGDLGEFVSIEAITKADGRKVVINDGSTGIRDQLMELTTTRILKGMSRTSSLTLALEANSGLRVSRLRERGWHRQGPRTTCRVSRFRTATSNTPAIPVSQPRRPSERAPGLNQLNITYHPTLTG
jgi:hypothetical protein